LFVFVVRLVLFSLVAAAFLANKDVYIILASCKPGCKPGFRPGLQPGFQQVRAGL